MINVPEATMDRVKTLRKEILNLQNALSSQITEYNDRAGQLYNELIERDKEIHDEYVEELNGILGAVNQQMSDYFEGQIEEWKESPDGKAYEAWMDGWAQDFDEFDVEHFDELVEPTILDHHDFDRLAEDPGDIEFPDLGRTKASLERQALLHKWGQAVATGNTKLGFVQWCAEQLQLDAWKKEVSEEKTLLGFSEWVEQKAAACDAA